MDTNITNLTNLTNYNKYTGIWINDALDKFVCSESEKRNKTYTDWCIFDRIDDAREYCEQSVVCKGFVVSGDKHQIARMPVVPSTTNGTYYEKKSNGFKLCGKVVVILFTIVTTQFL